MTDRDENPFSTSDDIFAEKRVLKKDEMPDKIFHREDEIERYTLILEDIIHGHDPNNIFVYGSTGVGKTAVTKWIRNKLQERADAKDVPLRIIGPMNCRNYKSAYSLATALVNELRDRDNQIPSTGYSTDKVLEFLYEEIEAVGGNVLLILDEIDNIPPDARNDFLYELPRAETTENTAINDAKIGLIGISNDLKFVDVLEPKVVSTLGEREIKFGPYDANELTDILEYYGEIAFKDDVLEPGVIKLAAAFSAQERGDVRQGKQILQKAGEFARMDDSATVTEAHARRATETIETDELLDYFERDLTSDQAVVFIAATLAVIEPRNATTKHIYQLYTSLAESLDKTVKSERKIYEFLEQLSMQGLIRSNEQNLGARGGRRYIYEVMDNPLDIVKAIRKSSYSECLPENTDKILTKHLEEEASEYTAPADSNEEQPEIWDFT